MPNSQKGFAIVLILISILIAAALLGGLYLKSQGKPQSAPIRSQGSPNSEPNFDSIMQQLGCNSQQSCMETCHKPENEAKCRSLFQQFEGNKEGTLSNFNPKDIPPITASPMDVDRIIYLSKFRSDAGHDFSYFAWDGESCRSMKHYFNFGQYEVNGMPVRSTPGPGESNINIYSPFDGVITADLPEQTPIGRQIHIASEKNKSYFVTLFHIDLAPGLKVGSNVKSGQVVGTIGPKDGTDVAYMASLSTGKMVYLSIFDYMTDQAFIPYGALGYKRSDFVLTREQADTMGYKCNGEQFTRPNNFYSISGGSLEGYIQFKPNPYARQFNNQR